jgi:hypothetical protein
MFFYAFPSFGFLYVAARDMWRRRSLMLSLVALLSLRQEDRKKFLGLPEEVMALGVLDLKDIQTVEGFRLLRKLCMDWGRSFSMRISTFMNCFAGVTAAMMAYVLVFVETKQYDNLDRTQLLASVFTVVSLGSMVVLLALLGGGVNSASDRIVFLLNKHAMSLHAEAGRATRDEDAGAPPGVAEYVAAVASDIDADSKCQPVEMLGLYCGPSLISALYFLPAVWFSRLGNMCVDRPDLCTPHWYEFTPSS